MADTVSPFPKKGLRIDTRTDTIPQPPSEMTDQEDRKRWFDYHNDGLVLYEGVTEEKRKDFARARRGMAAKWLMEVGLKSTDQRNQFLKTFESMFPLEYPHTFDGLQSYFRDLKREYAARKESLQAQTFKSPFGKPLSPTEVEENQRRDREQQAARHWTQQRGPRFQSFMDRMTNQYRVSHNRIMQILGTPVTDWPDESECEKRIEQMAQSDAQLNEFIPPHDEPPLDASVSPDEQIASIEWHQDKKKRDRWFAEWGEECDKRGVPKDARDTIRHNALRRFNVEHLNDLHGVTKDTFTQACQSEITIYLELEANNHTSKEPTSPPAPTKEEWTAWLKRWTDLGYEAKEVLEALAFSRPSSSYPAIEKFRDWRWGLDEATRVMEQDWEKRSKLREHADLTLAKAAPANETAPAGTDAPARLETRQIAPDKAPLTVQIYTLAGVPLLQIGQMLNKPLPADAYREIKFGQMSGKTDIDGDRVRDRFDEVFGAGGWRINPHQLAGRVEHKIEERQDSKSLKTYHIVTLTAHTFSYAAIMPDGSITWVDASTTSDMHDNLDEQYAYRGAFTSLMKQFYRLLGGMNHIMYGEYTHKEALSDLNKRRRN